MHRGNEVLSAVPVPSELKTKAISVSLKTNYPFENTLFYQVKAQKDSVFTVRIPSFAKNLTVNGKNVEKTDFLNFRLMVEHPMTLRFPLKQHRYFKIALTN